MQMMIFITFSAVMYQTPFYAYESCLIHLGSPTREVLHLAPELREFPVTPHWVFLPTHPLLGAVPGLVGIREAAVSAAGRQRGSFLAGIRELSGPLDQLLGVKSTLVAVSRAGFLLVEAMCRCLAESKDEEEMRVPLQDTVQQDQHQAFARVATFSRAAGTGPQVQHHVNAPLGTHALLFDASSFRGLCKLCHFVHQRWPWKSTGGSMSNSVS